MAIAAITPRVRTIVVCDEASESSIEDRVFSLEGVRCHVLARSMPWRIALCLFLLLSSPRKGRYSGSILIVNEKTDKTIRYLKFTATFQDDEEILPMYVDTGYFLLSEPGRYLFQILFTAQGSDVLKGEHPLQVYIEE